MKGKYDIVFDMQCFHVLRESNEMAIVNVICELVRPNGYIIVVAGNLNNSLTYLLTHLLTHSGAINDEGSDDDDDDETAVGPPLLAKHMVIDPFLSRMNEDGNNPCVELVNLTKSRFNSTAAYSANGTLPPRCWIALFRRL